MAFFGVTKEIISNVKNHPNADRLDICTLEGMSFQFVTERGKHHVGEQVLYFPVDCVFPLSLMKKMGLTKETIDENGNSVIEGILNGRERNHLKTVRLRGEISQGIVGSIDLLGGNSFNTPEDITNYLGITKYEDICNHDMLGPLPVELTKYDIEGAQRYNNIVSILMNHKVCITEKLEGMNFSITYRPKTDEFFVNQHSRTILLDNKNHPFLKWMNKISIMEEIKSKTWECDSITFYGEFLGPKVQGNIYKFSDYRVYFYDIFMDGHFLDVSTKQCIFKDISCMDHVPILFYNELLSNILNGRSIVDFSNGKSVFYPCNREGIVITPMKEQQILGFGRLILKQRSPEYLVKSKN